MTEKFINSLHNGPAITPSIHDCKIIKPKELSRGKQLGLLGFGVIELGCSFTNILPVLLMTLTGLEMFISGIESNNPAELIGGVGMLTTSSIVSRLAIRMADKSDLAFTEALNSSKKSDRPQNKLKEL